MAPIDNATGQPRQAPATQVILSRYEMVLGKPGFLGAGSFSTVQRGLDLWTGKSVAIKQFKMSEMQKDLKTNVTKFKRQIEVLQYLMEPLKREEIVDPMLQHEYFWTVD
eukprot:g3646.t1